MSDSAMHTLTRLTVESLQVFNRTSARVRRAARGIRKRNVVSHVAPVSFRATDLYDVSMILILNCILKQNGPGPVAWGGGEGSLLWTGRVVDLCLALGPRLSALGPGCARSRAVEPRDGTARRAYPGEEPQFDQNPGHLISLQMEAPSLYGHKVGSSTELLLA